MPSFAGMLAASVAGWLVEGPISGLLGPTPGLIASFVVGTVVFCIARQYVTNLRDGT